MGQARETCEPQRRPSGERCHLQVSGLRLDLPPPHRRLAVGAEPPVQVHLRGLRGRVHRVRIHGHHYPRAGQVHVVRWVICVPITILY